MTFLTPTDAIVIMDTCPACTDGVQRHLTYDELSRLHEAGVQTVMEYVPWGQIERSFGQRDWSHLDEYIERARKAGIKVILSTPHRAPACFPREWYPWDREGNPLQGRLTGGGLGALSVFEPAAQEYLLRFIREARFRFEADDVFLWGSQQVEGETFYSNGWAYGEPAAQAAWREQYGNLPMVWGPQLDCFMRDAIGEAMREIHSAFLDNSVHQEIWCAAHPHWSEFHNTWAKGNGDRWVETYFAEWHHLWPIAEITWLQYTYWPHDQPYRNDVKRIQAKFGMHLVAGAEWIEGLQVNTSRAIQDNLSALLLGIIHPLSGHSEIEPWEYDVIRDKAAEILRSRGIYG